MSEVQTVADYFGCNVFSDKVMRDRLPKNIYKSVMNTKKFGIALDDDVANVVANAMKDWAIEKGATHYTHWFQPMTCASPRSSVTSSAAIVVADARTRTCASDLWRPLPS